MKAQVKKTVEVKLILSVEEAQWLRSLVQNPIGVEREE